MAGEPRGVPGLSGDGPVARGTSPRPAAGAGPLILASASPRRAAALRAAGQVFEIVPADVDESVRPGEAPLATVRRLARAKAAAVAAHRRAALVLGADTLLELDGRALGKPADRDEAEAMLVALSGRRHLVHTALALLPGDGGDPQEGVASAEVEFARLDGAALAVCLDGEEWRDKAGAYALQGRAGHFARVVSGEADTVVGFPARLFFELLARCRVALPALWLAAALLVPPACGGTEPGLSAAPTGPRPGRLQLSVAGRTVTVELAVTEAERNRGLMHRTALDEDAGMLFLFADDRPRTFWMLNTLIPLDIIFLDADGTVQNIERGQPGVERPGYHSRRPARMVLELNGGWSARHGLRPGDVIDVPQAIRALPRD